jgi:hypothetical protein
LILSSIMVMVMVMKHWLLLLHPSLLVDLAFPPFLLVTMPNCWTSASRRGRQGVDRVTFTVARDGADTYKTHSNSTLVALGLVAGILVGSNSVTESSL